MKFLVTLMFQLCLNYFRRSGEDMRLVYDNPEGTLTFQGTVKYAHKMAIPKRPNKE